MDNLTNTTTVVDNKFRDYLNRQVFENPVVRIHTRNDKLYYISNVIYITEVNNWDGST